MVVHYFTLRALAVELAEILRFSTISEAFSQQKNELCLVLKKDGEEKTLCISIESGLNYCYIRDEFVRAKKNSIDLFEPLLSETVKTVEIHPYDRVLLFHTESGLTLCCLLYNTAASNIILMNADSVIIGAFKHEKELAGTRFEIKTNRKTDLGMTEEEFIAFCFENPEMKVQDALKAVVPVFGTMYMLEVYFRAGVENARLLGTISAEQIRKLYGAITGLVAECLLSNPIVYSKDSIPAFLSMTSLYHAVNMDAKECAGVNEAVAMFISRTLQTRGFAVRKKELLNKLRRAVEQSERTVQAIQKELSASERAVEYEHIGHTLMANYYTVVKGAKQVIMADIYDDSVQLTIALDPALTAHQNAERYFDKARKAKTSRIESTERLESEQRRLGTLKTMLNRLEGCEDSLQLKEFLKANETAGLVVQTENEEERIPFRVFTVAGGYEVWVGKSSANNDLLTMSYAKPNDIWFHARGVGGSHTVLKARGGKQAPPMEAIEQAASIAAYYSKMRNASNVAVAYCERKYVRKPKHAPEGAVLLEREKVIFVEPHLP